MLQGITLGKVLKFHVYNQVPCTGWEDLWKATWIKQPVGFLEHLCSLHKDNFLSQTRSYAIFFSTTVINPHSVSKSRLYFFLLVEQCLNKIEMYVGLILKKWEEEGIHYTQSIPRELAPHFCGWILMQETRPLNVGAGGGEERRNQRFTPLCSSKVHTPCSSKLTGTKIDILRSSSSPLSHIKNIHGMVSREHLQEPLRHVEEPFGNGAGVCVCGSSLSPISLIGLTETSCQ